MHLWLVVVLAWLLLTLPLGLLVGACLRWGREGARQQTVLTEPLLDQQLRDAA